MTIPGVLLTGGRSLRMGMDKATLMVAGETLAARAARILSSVCDPVIEVGVGATSLPCVREFPPLAGPLIAFFAGVDALGVEGPAILLACDIPNVSAELLRVLIDHPSPGSVVPTVDWREQSACARWSAAAIARARGGRALGALLDADDVEFVPFDDWGDALTDVDTQEDLHRLGLS